MPVAKPQLINENHTFEAVAPILPAEPDCPLTPHQLRDDPYQAILDGLPKNESGEKYLRELVGLKNGKADVYTVIATFDVRSGGCQQALKKILNPGARGVKDKLQDLREAIDALVRDVEIEIDRQRRAASDDE